MQATVEFIILPYDASDDRTLMHILLRELGEGGWDTFRAAVAFARQSGNYVDLLEAIEAFLDAGGQAELTFGADVFGADTYGSEYDALETLLSKFSSRPGFKAHLYHEPGRTFHPKIFLFSNEEEARALVIVGSSNWSKGGFISNVEADVLVWLDLADDEHRAAYAKLVGCFEAYWTETA